MLELDKIENGSFVIVNKPIGITSHDVVNIIRESIDMDRVGHSGTLDKNVSGVLVIGIGPATRLLEYLLSSPKEYRCVMQLHQNVERDELVKLFKHFTGKINQIPPIKSSVKREEREREVYSITPVDFDESKREVEFITKVEKGTYIRKLCHDMGEYLGTGAHMKFLKRTAVGPFTISNENLTDIYEFKNICENVKHKIFNGKHKKRLDKVLLPARDLVDFLPLVKADEETSEKICDGQKMTSKICNKLKYGDDLNIGSTVRIVSEKGDLIAVGTLKAMFSDVNECDEVIKLNKVFPRGI